MAFARLSKIELIVIKIIIWGDINIINMTNILLIIISIQLKYCLLHLIYFKYSIVVELPI